MALIYSASLYAPSACDADSALVPLTVAIASGASTLPSCFVPVRTSFDAAAAAVSPFFSSPSRLVDTSSRLLWLCGRSGKVSLRGLQQLEVRACCSQAMRREVPDGEERSKAVSSTPWPMSVTHAVYTHFQVSSTSLSACKWYI